jgi:hypothetical protein
MDSNKKHTDQDENFKTVQNLVEETPNDQILGSRIRHFINSLKSGIKLTLDQIKKDHSNGTF